MNVALLCLTLAIGMAEAPKVQAQVHNPQEHVVLAVQHLTGPGNNGRPLFPEDERCFVRFVSFYYAGSDTILWLHVKVCQWWLNNMSFETAPAMLQEVRGSSGRLYALDIRDFLWNAPAWEAVALREPYFREPWLNFRECEALRRMAGYGHISKSDGNLKGGTLPCMAIVRADWLMRETWETDRSTSYYDLLYARFRFKAGGHREDEVVEKTPYEKRVEFHHPGGEYTSPAGKYYANLAAGHYSMKVTEYRETRKTVTADAAKFVDFPRDEADWDKAFGIDITKNFAKEIKLDLDFGAVVAGGRNHPEVGSIVALNDRILAILQGPFGAAMKSFDAEKTSGNRDYVETLIFDGRKFRRGDGVKAEFDAGELLNYLPNGGQACLLINKDKKRVEIAGSKVAADRADKVINSGVRNPGSCITCHAGAGGFIPPRDLIKGALDVGIDLKFKDREQRNRVRAFFLGWDDRIKAYTVPYDKLIRATTVLRAKDKPMTGAEIGEAVLRIRGDYDLPVDVARGARELGVPIEAFKYLCSRSPKARVLLLLQGQSIPRSTWEATTFREMGLLLDAHRNNPDFDELFAKVKLKMEYAK